VITPHYADEHVTLYCGDFRDLLPDILAEHGEPALTIADPPYGETSLTWDRWPDGWPQRIPGRAMWCFGSLRMLLDRRDEFAGWQLSHDRVWEKHNGTGFATDRFRRVHEFMTLWYRGSWDDVHHEVPRVPRAHNLDKSVTRNGQPSHTRRIGASSYVDDGLRIARSVVKHPSVRGGISRTEKPVPVIADLIAYGCPAGGLVFDPFAGSAATLVAARLHGRKAVGVEADPGQCDKAARRLSEGVCRSSGGLVVDHGRKRLSAHTSAKPEVAWSDHAEVIMPQSGS
jgi:site-specific DNA-methyltransferase (adenine-specific)